MAKTTTPSDSLPRRDLMCINEATRSKNLPCVITTRKPAEERKEDLSSFAGQTAATGLIL